jgi:hypothetical protein
MIQWIFSEREHGFEAKYVQDQEKAFRLHAKRDHLFGLWAASQLGYAAQAAEEYAASLVAEDVHPATPDAILARVARDLAPKVSEAAIRIRFAECDVEARREILLPGSAPSR